MEQKRSGSLKNRHHPKTAFIVAVTAHAIKGDREKYLGMGMDEYVSKPVSMNVISGIIDKFLAERDMSQA